MHKNNTFTTVLAVFAFLVIAVSVIPAATNAAGAKSGFTDFNTLFGTLFHSSRPAVKVINGTVTSIAKVYGQDIIAVQGNPDSDDGNSYAFSVQLASQAGLPKDWLTARAHAVPGAVLSIGVDASNIQTPIGGPAYVQGYANIFIQVGDAVSMQGTMTGTDFSTFVPTSIIDKTLIQNFVHTGKVTDINISTDEFIGLVTPGGTGYYVLLSTASTGGGSGGTGLGPFAPTLDTKGASVLVPIGGVTNTQNVTIPQANIKSSDTITVIGPVSNAVGDPPRTNLPGSSNVNPIPLAPLLIIDQNPNSVQYAKQLCSNFTVVCPGGGSTGGPHK